MSEGRELRLLARLHYALAVLTSLAPLLTIPVLHTGIALLRPPNTPPAAFRPAAFSDFDGARLALGARQAGCGRGRGHCRGVPGACGGALVYRPADCRSTSPAAGDDLFSLASDQCAAGNGAEPFYVCRFGPRPDLARRRCRDTAVEFTRLLLRRANKPGPGGAIGLKKPQ